MAVTPFVSRILLGPVQCAFLNKYPTVMFQNKQRINVVTIYLKCLEEVMSQIQFARRPSMVRRAQLLTAVQTAWIRGRVR